MNLAGVGGTALVTSAGSSPRRSRNRGTVRLATGTVVGVLALLGCDRTTPGPEEDAPLSNEERIRTLVQSGYQAMQNADYERFNGLQCKKYRSPETGESNDEVPEVLRGVVLDDVNSIVVNGDTATAVARHHMANAPDESYTNTVALELENGIWTLC